MIEDRKLRKDSRVTVYHNPKTKEKEEGVATLVKRQDDGGSVYLDVGGFEVWSLKFDHNPDEKVNRIVSSRDLHPEPQGTTTFAIK